MAKQIRFDYKGEHYALYFTRRTIRQMEADGFVAADIQKYPATVFSELFAGAFRANHPFIKQKLVNEIFEAMPNKADLVGELSEMYTSVLEAMMADPKDKEQTLVWKTEEM